MFLRPGWTWPQSAYVQDTKTRLNYPGGVADATLGNQCLNKQLKVALEEHLLVALLVKAMEDLWVLAADIGCNLVEGWLRLRGSRGHDVCLLCYSNDLVWMKCFKADSR